MFEVNVLLVLVVGVCLWGFLDRWLDYRERTAKFRKNRGCCPLRCCCRPPTESVFNLGSTEPWKFSSTNWTTTTQNQTGNETPPKDPSADTWENEGGTPPTPPVPPEPPKPEEEKP